MKAISHHDIARAIYLATKDIAGTAQMDKMRDVTKFLARRRLLSKKKQILASLEKIVNQSEGIVVAKLRSVEKLNHHTEEELQHSLKKRYGAKAIVFEEEIDKSLLGGVRIVVNDEVLDLSLQNKVRQLQEHLTAQI